MSKRDVFIAMLDTEPTDKKVSRGWLLSLQPMTTKDALWRMSWQRGGHMAGDPDLHMILAKASEFTGIMEHTHTKAPSRPYSSFKDGMVLSHINNDLQTPLPVFE